MKPTTIRPVTEQDIPFLWDMLYESLHVREGQAPFGREILREPGLAKYVDGWGRTGDIGFIAFNGEGSPIGSITARYFTDADPGYGYIGSDVPELGMAISPVYRGQGIGTALMRALMDELGTQGIKRISLSVDPENLAAVKLYERFGFAEVGKVGTSITMLAEVE